MTTRKELAQRLGELPAFNLRFGSRVDIFNLPTEDRDLIVRSLQEADDFADKGQNLAAEFEKLREKILALTIERDELGGKCRALAAENGKLEERRRTMATEQARLEERCRTLEADQAPNAEKLKISAAEQVRLEEKCRALEADRVPTEEKLKALAAELAALDDKFRQTVQEKVQLVADSGRLQEKVGKLTADLDGALDTLVRLINDAEGPLSVVSWLKARHPEKAVNARPTGSVAGGWRPIASAPKDNAPVNLIGRNPAGRWVQPVATRRNMISADAGVDQWLDWEFSFAPTHWSPIPATPAVPAAPAMPAGPTAPADPAEKAAGKLDPSGVDQSWLQEDLHFLSKTNRP
jgi:uncharacterized coiled-coil DUF342 family protein